MLQYIFSFPCPIPLLVLSLLADEYLLQATCTYWKTKVGSRLLCSNYKIYHNTGCDGKTVDWMDLAICNSSMWMHAPCFPVLWRYAKRSLAPHANTSCHWSSITFWASVQERDLSKPESSPFQNAIYALLIFQINDDGVVYSDSDQTTKMDFYAANTLGGFLST